MADLLTKFNPIEPLMSDRWFLKIEDVPMESFVSCEMEAYSEPSNKRFEGNIIYNKLKFKIRNTVNFLLNPDDVINLDKIKLVFLDPVGCEINYYNMNIEFDRMSLVCDYGSSEILTHDFSFFIKKINVGVVPKDFVEKDKLVLENYLKNKEQISSKPNK